MNNLTPELTIIIIAINSIIITLLKILSEKLVAYINLYTPMSILITIFALLFIQLFGLNDGISIITGTFLISSALINIIRTFENIIITGTTNMIQYLITLVITFIAHKYMTTIINQSNTIEHNMFIILIITVVVCDVLTFTTNNDYR